MKSSFGLFNEHWLSTFYLFGSSDLNWSLRFWILIRRKCPRCFSHRRRQGSLHFNGEFLYLSFAIFWIVSSSWWSVFCVYASALTSSFLEFFLISKLSNLELEIVVQWLVQAKPFRLCHCGLDANNPFVFLYLHSVELLLWPSSPSMLPYDFPILIAEWEPIYGVVVMVQSNGPDLVY